MRHLLSYARETVEEPADIRADRDPVPRIIPTDRRADVRIMAALTETVVETAAASAADSLRRIRTTTRSTTIIETSRRDLPSRSRIFRRKQRRKRQTSLHVMLMRSPERIRKQTPRRITRSPLQSIMTAVPVTSVPTSLPVMHRISSPMMRLLIRCTWAARARRR